ncbi:MAG TPA: hypothetical protein VFB62_16950, partial [Polyangiaceae bacterium]|nr:hypothetical protein [Polyangiaceae bacterium]
MKLALFAFAACLVISACQDTRRSAATPEPRTVERPKIEPPKPPRRADAPAPAPVPLAKGGPCPPPGEPELLAFRTARKFAASTGPAPGRLRAEAVRARLAQVVAHGCARGAADTKLLEVLRELEPENADPAVLESLWLARRKRGLLVGGGSGWVALFREVDNGVEMPIVVNDEGTAMEQQLLVLDADIF